MAGDRQLIISDLQIPFDHELSLKFCVYLKRHFKIADDDVYNVGDETDQYWGGLWDKSPDAAHTANQEIKASIEKLGLWYARFPHMKLCLSNHGTRWIRKAFAAQIPSQLLRTYREIIQAPDGWHWKPHWDVGTKHPFLVEHGDDWGGQHPHIAAALHNGKSTVMGHHHCKFTVAHMKTKGVDIWGAVAGSLIDFEQYAFEYGRKAKLKPQIGAIVILDKGKTVLPIHLSSAPL